LRFGATPLQRGSGWVFGYYSGIAEINLYEYGAYFPHDITGVALIMMFE